LLFDLDETLIHIWRDKSEMEDGFEPDIDIPIYDPVTDKQEPYGLSVRPFVKECLIEANKFFEVAVFTASYEWFATHTLDYLDPDGTLIQHRYYRQHTSQLDDLLVKDLNIFQGEVTLDDILIVDNNIYSFAFQLENGIPILDFLGDPTDSELLKVIKYLKYL
jgi:Dullard-like phosphatase family protein